LAEPKSGDTYFLQNNKKTRLINVVNWLQRQRDELHIIPDKLQKLGIDTSIPDWAEILGHEMFQLNIKAIDARYGNGEAVKFRKLDYHFEHTEAVPLEQVLKSLNCWLYQCSEGDIPETALYNLFDTDVRLYLMSEITTRLPEYEKADWG
jgi:hypothetical protein